MALSMAHTILLAGVDVEWQRSSHVRLHGNGHVAVAMVSAFGINRLSFELGVMEVMTDEVCTLCCTSWLIVTRCTDIDNDDKVHTAHSHHNNDEVLCV